jgi:DNA-binding transcriptional regulator LsrR (DeoR family)
MGTSGGDAARLERERELVAGDELTLADIQTQMIAMEFQRLADMEKIITVAGEVDELRAQFALLFGRVVKLEQR